MPKPRLQLIFPATAEGERCIVGDRRCVEDERRHKTHERKRWYKSRQYCGMKESFILLRTEVLARFIEITPDEDGQTSKFVSLDYSRCLEDRMNGYSIKRW